MKRKALKLTKDKANENSLLILTNCVFLFFCLVFLAYRDDESVELIKGVLKATLTALLKGGMMFHKIGRNGKIYSHLISPRSLRHPIVLTSSRLDP